MTARIAFQGEPGAYSHQACVETRPEFEPMPCATFEDVIEAVDSGAAELAMLPVENTTYGRVADIHRLLPHSGLHIIDEAFVRVHINVLGVPGATVEDIEAAHSHLVLLPQCAGWLRENNVRGRVSPDNARAARDVAEAGDKTQAALASELAAEVYGLDVLARHSEDEDHNTTRFLVIGAEVVPPSGQDKTSILVSVKNKPGALYHVLEPFHRHNVSLTRLETRPSQSGTWAYVFYIDFEGHIDNPEVKAVISEISPDAVEIKHLGSYPVGVL